MDDNIDAVEEVILLALQDALTEELGEMIEEINRQKGEIWLEGLEKVLIGEGDLTFERKPCALITVKKGKRETSDSIVDVSEYVLILRLAYGDGEMFTAYRYAAVLDELVKKSETLKALADRIIIDELEYFQGKGSGSCEDDEAEFRIRFVREGF